MHRTIARSLYLAGMIEAAEVMDSKITIEVVEGMTKDVTTEEVRVVKFSVLPFKLFQTKSPTT